MPVECGAGCHHAASRQPVPVHGTAHACSPEWRDAGKLGESLQRAEVRRFAERVITRYLPPKTDVAVLLPCSAKKPYSLSQSHRKFGRAIAGRAHELIVTSPLGLVPRELECIYPAGHYDVPVTGYWDAEECAVIANILTRYFERHPYRRIIAHLEGGALKVARMAAEACGVTLEHSCQEHLTSDSALNALDSALAGERRIKDDRLHGMVSYQFNIDLDTKGTTVRGHYPELFYSKKNVQIFSIDTGTGLLRPHLTAGILFLKDTACILTILSLKVMCSFPVW